VVGRTRNPAEHGNKYHGFSVTHPRPPPVLPPGNRTTVEERRAHAARCTSPGKTAQQRPARPAGGVNRGWHAQNCNVPARTRINRHKRHVCGNACCRKTGNRCAVAQRHKKTSPPGKAIAAVIIKCNSSTTLRNRTHRVNVGIKNHPGSGTGTRQAMPYNRPCSERNTITPITARRQRPAALRRRATATPLTAACRGINANPRGHHNASACRWVRRNPPE